MLCFIILNVYLLQKNKTWKRNIFVQVFVSNLVLQIDKLVALFAACSFLDASLSFSC